MNLFEFHFLDNDEVIRLNSRDYIPRRYEIIEIENVNFKVHDIKSKFEKNSSGCWLETVIIYLERQ
jgi:hypothetical protein